MDSYGLFASVEARGLQMHHNERTSKYLMSFRYIPENYTDLLLGASTSGNLRPELMASGGLYNASINGGNITETRLIAENVIARGAIQSVLICLDPSLTATSGRKTSYIDPMEYWSALGSFTTVKLYLNRALARKVDYFANSGNGALNYDPYTVGRDGHLAVEKLWLMGGWDFSIDEQAFGELKKFLADLRSKDIRVTAFFFPLARSLYLLGKDDFQEYKRRMLTAFQTDELVWDFNTPQFVSFTAEHGKFYDGIHLEDGAAADLAAEIRQVWSPDLP